MVEERTRYVWAAVGMSFLCTGIMGFVIVAVCVRMHSLAARKQTDEVGLTSYPSGNT